MNFDLAGKKVWVPGHKGMVGSAIMRRLQREPCTLLVAERTALDLKRQTDVESWMDRHRPQVVVLAAARVGGLHANSTFPVDFLYDNLVIETNVIESAHRFGVEKLLFLGSSCIYPRNAHQPMTEDALLTGPLEPTNEWYAVAKIAGIKLCQAYRRQHGSDFISAMPTNLYGPGDNFHPDTSHVPAALLRRFDQARVEGRDEVVVWGSGKPRREFLYVEDLADACVHLLKRYSAETHINIGVGDDITIAEFAEAIKRCVGFEGCIRYDTARPDGPPRKLLDVSRMRALGWSASTSLVDGLRKYYEWFLGHKDNLRELKFSQA
jgi:GDP-L-fucose synthase